MINHFAVDAGQAEVAAGVGGWGPALRLTGSNRIGGRASRPPNLMGMG